MKYTAVSVHQLKNRKGKPWQARAKYKDANGKWKETSNSFQNIFRKPQKNLIAG